MKYYKIIVALIFTCLIIISCNSTPEPAKIKHIDNKLTDRLTPHNKEIWALLSVKYGIDEKALVNLLDEYENEHNIAHHIRKSLASDNVIPKRNVNYIETIISLSNKYSLPKEKIASMLLDYKIYTEYIYHEQS